MDLYSQNQLIALLMVDTIEVPQTEFEKARADRRCTPQSVIDDAQWSPKEVLFRLYCGAVVLSTMSGFRTRHAVKYSHGFNVCTPTLIIERIPDFLN